MRPASVAVGIALAVAATLSAPSAEAQSIWPELKDIIALSEEDPGAAIHLSKRLVHATVTIPVHGAKARKQVRRALWLLKLEGDRLDVYLDEGYPRHRYRENYAGRTRELWSYPESGLAYIFNEQGDLIDTRIYSIDLYRPPIVETYRPHLVFP